MPKKNAQPVVGDVALIAFTDRVGTRTTEGTIISLGRKNVVVETFSQFRPDGPEYRQEHRYPKADIVAFVHRGSRYADLEAARGHDVVLAKRIASWLEEE